MLFYKCASFEVLRGMQKAQQGTIPKQRLLIVLCCCCAVNKFRCIFLDWLGMWGGGEVSNSFTSSILFIVHGPKMVHDRGMVRDRGKVWASPKCL